MRVLVFVAILFFASVQIANGANHDRAPSESITIGVQDAFVVRPSALDTENLQSRFGRQKTWHVKTLLFTLGLVSYLPALALFKNSYHSAFFASTDYYNTWTALVISGFTTGQLLSNLITTQYLGPYSAAITHKERILSVLLFLIGCLCIAVALLSSYTLDQKTAIITLGSISGIFGASSELLKFCIDHMTISWSLRHQKFFGYGSILSEPLSSVIYLIMAIFIHYISEQKQVAVVVYYYLWAAISWFVCSWLCFFIHGREYQVISSPTTRSLNMVVNLNPNRIQPAVPVQVDSEPFSDNVHRDGGTHDLMTCRAPSCVARAQILMNYESQQIGYRQILGNGYLQIFVFVCFIIEVMSTLVVAAIIPNIAPLEPTVLSPLFSGPIGFVLNCFFIEVGKRLASSVFHAYRTGFATRMVGAVARLFCIIPMALILPFLFFCYYARNQNSQLAEKFQGFGSDQAYLSLLSLFSLSFGIFSVVVEHDQNGVYDGPVPYLAKKSLLHFVQLIGRALGCLVGIILLAYVK